MIILVCKFAMKKNANVYRHSRGTQREYSSNHLNIALLNVF